LAVLFPHAEDREVGCALERLAVESKEMAVESQ
jgi:hypothetical protein